MNASSAIICWKDKILLFHRDNIPIIPAPDCWQFPGGGIEKGETPLEAVKRELKEEVTHTPINIKFLGRFDQGDHFTYFYCSFVSDVEAKNFKLGKGEGQEIGFFTIDEALNLKLSTGINGYLVKFKKEIEEALKNKSIETLNKLF